MKFCIIASSLFSRAGISFATWLRGDHYLKMLNKHANYFGGGP